MSKSDKWNKNIFTVYDNEGKTVLRILQSIFDGLKEVFTDLDSKTDKNGDHMGTWQGLTPTETVEGISSQVTKNTEEIENVANNLEELKVNIENEVEGRQKVQYKTISLPYDINKSEESLRGQINTIKKVASDVVICPLVNVTSATTTDFETYNNTLFDNFTNIIIDEGINISMIKPHIVTAWSDGFNRTNYNPNVVDFFNNWLEVCEYYAEKCILYNIPMLCLSCEMDKLTIAENNAQWRTLINTLKTKYPTLKFACSLNAAEIWASNQYYIPQKRENYLNHIDIIGVNLYPKLSDKVYTPTTPNITLAELNKAWFNSVENDRVLERCFNLHSYYKKPIFVTEIGIMPKVDGLTKVLATGETSFKTQALYYESFFNTVVNSDFIIGFSIWNVQSPFNFTNGTSSYTESELVLRDYILGGIL